MTVYFKKRNALNKCHKIIDAGHLLEVVLPATSCIGEKGDQPFFFLFFLLHYLENCHKALVDRLDDPRVLGLPNVIAMILMV